MRYIKTEKIRLGDMPRAVSLATVFGQARNILQRENKVPVRMVLLNRGKKYCDLLVSFIYDEKGE